MADLVRQSDVTDRRRYVLSVVKECDYPGVKALQAAAVML